VRLRTILLAVLALLTVGSAIGAQIPTRPRPVPTRPDTGRAKLDSAARDSIARDSLARPKFAAPPDSVMQRLMQLKGYSTTRYQGEIITFDAFTRAIQLTAQAIVQRDSQLIKSDTIAYSGTGSRVRVGTSPNKQGNIFIGPGQAPIVSTGSGTYDLATRRASIGGVRTKIPQSGQELTITGEQVTVVAGTDSLKDANSATYYLRSGTVTACEDSIPDYFFKAGEIKRTGSFVVARPAILYIGDVPVMWLPFLFQDIRSGRHSGLIAPNLGVSDFIRNSKSYRRNVEGLGYYVALSDYMDAQVSLDWRSNAGEADFNDPGYMRYNGEFRYRWLDRFISGNIALSHTRQGGQINNALSWGHQQSFSRNSSFAMNLNLVKNTTLQRQTTVNPYSALATISSQANYQHKLGPMQLSLGGSQKQYPGRTQLDRQFPTVSLTTSPLNIASWFSWTPSFNYTSSQSLGIDQPSALGLLLRTGKTLAGIDTVFGDTLRRSARNSNLTFDTPVTIFGYNVGNSFSITSSLNDFPERQIVTNVVTGEETDRIYAQTYRTEVSWNPQFTLPPMARNNFNFSPSLSFANVDPSAFCLRNERTGGAWVCQSKRPSIGVSAAPTIFGLFSGFGPFQRFRHSISPTIGYSYAPASDVSDEFLAAIGRTRFSRTPGQSGYLGALAQNSLTFGLSTNIEAKLRSANDSNPEAGEKVKLASINFTSLGYDFERARATKNRMRGLTSQNFGYTVRSDLLPGFDLGVDYSLFEGSTLSDSAKFSPYRERITSSFQFSNTANPFAVFARLFGRAVPASAPGTDRLDQTADDRYARQVASQPVAGRAARSAAFLPTTTKGWQASFTFTSARQRPITGTNVVQYDPTTQCAALNTALLRIQYEQCVANARANPNVITPITSGTVGSTIYVSPPTTSLGSNLNFNLTERWAASWQTQYDFVQHDFASQIVSLQRDLHDWRAIFAFTQSPNGSFAFNFIISLKAEPDLKFDYHKSTYRNEGFR
jgi:hypothetical protein